MRRLAELSQQRLDQVNAHVQEYNQARTEYKQSARERYSHIPNLRIQDYEFLDALNVIVNNPGYENDGELERDRGIAAAIYASAIGKDTGEVYQNLEAIHEEWTGQQFVKTGGLQKAINAIRFGYNSRQISNLAESLHNAIASENMSIRGMNDETQNLLKGIDFVSGKTRQQIEEELERRLVLQEELRDDVPRPWQKEYIS